MVDARRISASEAAQILGVSARRVRQLLDGGELEAEVIGGHAVFDADSVYRRLEHRPLPGRPLSPELAWAVLAVLSLDELSWEDALRSAAPDRRLRHRLVHQLNSPRDAREWRQLLRRRADSERCWAHPSVISDLLADPWVSAGRARAAAEYGFDVSPGDEAYAYVSRGRVGELEKRYELEPDSHGGVELMIYDEGQQVARPVPGHPVPVAAAVVDMLDSNDARLQHQAASWFRDAIARRIQPSSAR